MISQGLKAKVRMKFTDSKFRKEFLELCLKEVEKEGYSGASLKNVSWNRMIQELKLKCNKECTQKQLKNQWDYLRRCYTAWRMLVKRADNAYNEETGTFDLPDHVWDDIIQKYPDTRKYKSKPLGERYLLKTLFEPTIDTADETFSPEAIPLTQHKPEEEEEQEEQEEEQEDEKVVYADVEPLKRVPPYDSYFTGCNFYGVLSNPTLEQGEKSDAGSSCYLRRRKRERFEDPLMKKVDDLIDLIKGDNVEKEKEKILDECLVKMKEFLAAGLLEINLYMASLKAFCDNLEYRKLFLRIESEEHKVLFLRTITGKV